jgi:Arc/MetJ-type ribon-helix-helix transcriptional regulator
MRQQMERIALRLPKYHLDVIDALVHIGEYTSRSDVIRTAIRELVHKEADKVSEGIEKMEKIKRITDLANKLSEFEKK